MQVYEKAVLLNRSLAHQHDKQDLQEQPTTAYFKNQQTFQNNKVQILRHTRNSRKLRKSKFKTDEKK